jgi:hypothetical protein
MPIKGNACVRHLAQKSLEQLASWKGPPHTRQVIRIRRDSRWGSAFALDHAQRLAAASQWLMEVEYARAREREIARDRPALPGARSTRARLGGSHVAAISGRLRPGRDKIEEQRLTDKIYVDASQPATVNDGAGVQTDCPTLGEAVTAWQRLRPEQKIRATIKVIGGPVYTAHEIDRLHPGAKPE